MIRVINELCDGNPTEETEEFVKSLDRPLQNIPNNDIQYLFGTNFDVEFMNQEKLDELIPGPPKYFRSLDTGKVDLLHKIVACKVLSVKVGAPVILIRNISGLSNG